MAPLASGWTRRHDPRATAQTAGGRVMWLDAHVHVYAAHDVDWLLRQLLAHAGRWAPGALAAMVLLARRQVPDAWSRWVQTGAGIAGWRVSPAGGNDPACDLVSARGRVRVYPGRQLVTAERLEVAAIGCADDVPEGLDLDETCAAIRSAGCFPVPMWGAGKWLGARGRHIRDWAERTKPGEGALGDTGMRPLGWPMPAAMRLAAARGLPVLAGSDPMPRAPDARLAGRYGSRISLCRGGVPDTADLVQCLADPGADIRPSGRRSNPVTFLVRQLTAMRRQVSMTAM